MEPITNLPPIVPAKETTSILGRALASFGSEIDQLLAVTKEPPIPPSTLGTKVDIRA